MPLSRASKELANLRNSFEATATSVSSLSYHQQQKRWVSKVKFQFSASRDSKWADTVGGGYYYTCTDKEPDCRLSVLRAPRQRGKGSQLGTATSSLNRKPWSAAASCVRDPAFQQCRAHGGPRTSTTQRPGKPHTHQVANSSHRSLTRTESGRLRPARHPDGPRAAAGIRPAPPPGPAALPGPRDELGASRALSADPHGPPRPGPAPRPQQPAVSRPALPPRTAPRGDKALLPSPLASPPHPTRVRPSAPSSAPPSLSSPRVSSHPPPRPEVTPRKRADPRFLPSLAFFLLASVPPSLPRKESSFFLDGGDFGVGDLGEEGDFWGDDAMAARPALGDGGDGCEAPEPWEAAPGSERKRNYSRHLRQLRAALPLLPCLPPALRHAPRPAAAPLRPHLSPRGGGLPAPPYLPAGRLTSGSGAGRPARRKASPHRSSGAGGGAASAGEGRSPAARAGPGLGAVRRLRAAVPCRPPELRGACVRSRARGAAAG